MNGKYVDGLGTEVALPVAGLNKGSRGVEETEAFGGKAATVRQGVGGCRDINTE